MGIYMKKMFAFLSALLIIGIGGSLAYGMQKNMHKLPIRNNFEKDVMVSAWDWHNPLTYTQEELDDTASFLRDNQFTTTFLDISVFQNTIDDTDTTAKDELSKQIESYITTMNDYGIDVYAASGNTDWSKPAQWSIPQAIQNYVHEYNQSHTAKFAGIEFDIESYNQTGFPEASMTEKELVLLELLDLVDNLATRHQQYVEKHKDVIDLGFAIPYWFDNENQNIESISWHNKTGPTLYHLLDRLNSLPRSNVVVMAYRNAALGNDGIVYHSRTEIEYAQSKAPNVDIIIGAEVTDVEPAKITFYGKSMAELTNEFKLVADEFKVNGTYGGVAVNDLKGLKEL